MANSSQRPLLIIAGIAIVVILVGIGIRQRHQATTTPSTSDQTSGNPVLIAFHNWQQAQSYSADISLALHLPEMNGQVRRPFKDVSLNFTGDVKKNNDGTPEAAGRLHGEAQGAGTQLSTDGEIRVLADSTIFTLNTVPILLDPTGSLTNKWTLVDTKLLRTTNKEAIAQALEPVLNQLKDSGKETQDGLSVVKYEGTVTPDQATALQKAFAADNSSNQIFNIVARLLAAYNVKTLTVWVDPAHQQVHSLEVVFVDRNQTDTQRAGLNITLKDFGKDVTIDRPHPVETVPPTVFAQFFGTGQVATPTPKVTVRSRR